MTRREPLDLPRTPRAEAAGWLALKRSGRMSEQEARALSVWLEGDAASREAFERLEAIWAEAGEVREDPEIMEVREWAVRAYNRPRAHLAIAAGLVGAAVVGVAALVASGVLGQLGWFAQTQEQELRTGLGQTTTVTLPDGSVVTLDTDTELRARETGRQRLVELKKGQAFFRVAKDHTRPFIVSAAGKTVTATGTAFEVRLDPHRFQVTLVEGKVAVEAPRGQFWRGQSADMLAGWRLTAEDDRRWKLSQVDVGKETSWMSGRLTFFNDPLGEAAAEVNRYSEKKVEVDPAVAGVPVIGVFRTGDVEGFIKAVRLTGVAVPQDDSATKVSLAAPR